MFQVVVRPTGTDPAEARLNRPVGDRSRTQQRDPAAEKALEHVGSTFLQWLRLDRGVSPVVFHDKWPSLTTAKWPHGHCADISPQSPDLRRWA